MAISLAKGQKIDLTKTNPGLTKLLVGLGWDTNKYDGGSDFDLDASVFLCAGSGKVEKESNFVFFNNPTAPGVVHTGDNKTGAGDGDDEVIKIELASVESSVDKIDFTVTIHEADTRRQNFGMVSNAYIRVVNADTNEELVRYDLGEDYSVETAVVVGQLYRNGAEWKFNAIGSGFSGGLAALVNNYGLSV